MHEAPGTEGNLSSYRGIRAIEKYSVPQASAAGKHTSKRGSSTRVNVYTFLKLSSQVLFLRAPSDILR
jgi:hypothetical protein